MKLSKHQSLISLFAFSAVALAGCNGSTEDTKEAASKAVESASAPVAAVTKAVAVTAATKGIDLSSFVKDAFTETPRIVDCKT